MTICQTEIVNDTKQPIYYFKVKGNYFYNQLLYNKSIYAVNCREIFLKQSQ